ncbi:MAG: LysR family transcriptional regulator, partial [Pseudomonadota bacterium]
MELRHFRMFSVLAEELHFGRAAHRLNTAQPVISKTLRDIEDELGIKLIDRSTRKAELTPAGHAFLREAHETLYHAEKALRSARASHDVGVERLTLGLTIGAAQPQIGKLVAAFEEKNPNAQVDIVAVDEAGLGRVLSEGTVDAVIAWDRSIPKGLKSKEVLRVTMKVLVPEHHPLAT